MKLYHYVHCPYCLRVRMGLGYLAIPYESVVLPYNDEKTPIALTGVKMLPILEIDGTAYNESLDILKMLDTKNALQWQRLESEGKDIDDLLNRIASPLYNLCMPYWIWTPEFDHDSRQYFLTKKEAKRGPFKNLVKKKETFLSPLNEILLNEVETKLAPFYRSDKFSIIDIMLAAQLWGMYLVPEFQFSAKMHNYLQSVKALTHFNYHQDFYT